MKERLEPYRGDIPEPNQMRGTFEECRYRAKILSRASVDNDPYRTIAGVLWIYKTRESHFSLATG